MWYVSGTGWCESPDGPAHRYHIKYAESSDGVTWKRHGVVAIDYASPSEHAFGRPFVIEQGGRHRMFYSVRTRSRGYRLGYAESTDGQRWTRKDGEVGIDVSASGWDSQMIEYASVVEHDGRTYLFYNGNNLGETGFGYAVLEHW